VAKRFTLHVLLLRQRLTPPKTLRSFPLSTSTSMLTSTQPHRIMSHRTNQPPRKSRHTHRKHPKPIMSLATNGTSSPSHLHNTNIRVPRTPKTFSRQKSRTSLETEPANIDNASEIRDPRTPQQAQDDGIYDYARSMRRVGRERHCDKQVNDQKLGIDQFMFLLSRDAKEGEKSKCDGARGANDSDDEEDMESRGESRSDSIA
jgi:hypothetical protein